MLSICRQLFGGAPSRGFCSGLVLRPVPLRTDINKWRDIHIKKLLELVRKNKISEATTYFYEEVKSPNRSIYSILLASIGRTGHTKLAFKLFRDLRARDIPPNPAILTSLFNSCANNDEDRPYALAKARNLYEQMKLQGWHPAPVTYHAMMKAFAVQGDCDTCFRLMDEMAAARFPITIDTYNHLLMGCIANKEIGYVLAIRVLRHMLWRRIRPNAISFNHLLVAAEKCGCGEDIQVLNKLLNDARRNQLKDPAVALISSGESLLDVRLKDQLVAVAAVPKSARERLLLVGGPEGVLTHMDYFNVTPTAVTYTHLLKAYSDEEELMKFVRSLNPVHLDMGFWNQLLKKCIFAKFSCVDEVVKMINDNKLKKDNITYGILALLARSEDEMRTFIKEMERRTFIPNEVIMSTLLTNAAIAHQQNAVVYLLDYCEQKDIRVNQKALQYLAKSIDRATHPGYIHVVNKALKRVKATSPDELTRSRLAQFEPRVSKRDRTRFDPEMTEVELAARDKGVSLSPEEIDTLCDDDFDAARNECRLVDAEANRKMA